MQDEIIKSVDELASAVKAKRRADGLTQEDLAAFSGLGRRFIVELEGGKATIRLDKVLKALEGLGLELVLRQRK